MITAELCDLKCLLLLPGTGDRDPSRGGGDASLADDGVVRRADKQVRREHREPEEEHVREGVDVVRVADSEQESVCRGDPEEDGRDRGLQPAATSVVTEGGRVPILGAAQDLPRVQGFDVKEEARDA